MEWLKTFYDTLAGYAFRWRTRGGYFRIGAGVLVAAWQFSRSAALPQNWTVAAAAAALFGWTVFWFIGSGRIPVSGLDKTVVFAIDVEVEAERNFRRIFQSLQTTMASLPVSSAIRIRRIGPDIVRNDKHAGKYLDNHKVAQVIWGRALAGKANNREIQKFEIHWTQQVPTPINLNAVISDLKLLAHGRKWTIADVDELIDVNILAEDFLEISLAVIGVIFLVEDNLPDAAVVYGRVVAGLERHSNPASVRSKIDRFREIHHQTLFAIADRAHTGGDHDKAVAILEKLLTFYPRDVEYRLTLARAHFLAGNKEAAVRYTDEIAALDQSHPAVYANRAFFAILDRKYRRAAEFYEKLARCRRDKLPVLTSVSEFLEERYAESPNEHAYLYGQAIVNGALDPHVKRSDLEQFLEVTADQEEYESMRENARAILGKMPS